MRRWSGLLQRKKFVQSEKRVVESVVIQVDKQIHPHKKAHKKDSAMHFLSANLLGHMKSKAKLDSIFGDFDVFVPHLSFFGHMRNKIKDILDERLWTHRKFNFLCATALQTLHRIA